MHGYIKYVTRLTSVKYQCNCSEANASGDVLIQIDTLCFKGTNFILFFKKILFIYLSESKRA